jgi:cytochrome b561
MMSNTEFPTSIKWLHWFTVIFLIFAFALVWLAPDEEVNQALHVTMIRWHIACGVVILFLSVLHILARLMQSIPPLPVNVPAINKGFARLVQLLLLLTVTIQPILGWLMVNAFGRSLSPLGLFTFPDLIAPDKALGMTLAEWHELNGTVIFVLAALHGTAALYHHFIRKDDILVRMLPRM